MGTCTLEGKGKVIDETKFFIVCLNCMGSPYGSASSLTNNPETGARYGPEFPLATIRDDCRFVSVHFAAYCPSTGYIFGAHSNFPLTQNQGVLSTLQKQN